MAIIGSARAYSSLADLDNVFGFSDVDKLSTIKQYKECLDVLSEEIDEDSEQMNDILKDINKSTYIYDDKNKFVVKYLNVDIYEAEIVCYKINAFGFREYIIMGYPTMRIIERKGFSDEDVEIAKSLVKEHGRDIKLFCDNDEIG